MSQQQRPRRHWLSTALVASFFAGWLPRLSLADTYDIGVYLFTDANCLFRANDFLILDGGCYANTWAPNSTKGWKMNIVFFNSPQRIDMREYVDDCHTLAMPKRTITTGTDRCSPFLGSMYAQFDIRFRSNTCKGPKCSQLSIAVQTFYSQSSCAGPAYSMFRYPVQGECMRAFNGTQDLVASSDGGNISLTAYSGEVNGDKCKSGTGTRTRKYAIENTKCYPLYTTNAPRSFSWRIETVNPYRAASDGFRSFPCLVTFAALFFGFAVRWRQGW